MGKITLCRFSMCHIHAPYWPTVNQKGKTCFELSKYWATLYFDV